MTIISDCLPTSAGVFRFEFTPNGDDLIAALTDGTLAQFSVNQRQQTSSVKASDSMLLDVSITNSSFLTSDNNGHVMLLDRASSSLIQTRDVHHLPYTNEGCEVWTCSFLNDTMYASGGEDAFLKIWDYRSDSKVAELKHFESGVTFVAPSKSDTDKIYTGSYDEHCRIFDTRNFSQVYKEIKLPGGVWNIEQGENDLLAACMYGGWTSMTNELEITSQDVDSGKQLLYGATMNKKYIAYVTFNDYRVTARQQGVTAVGKQMK
ncbi:unnamed protein product, partial [Mesorhabditis belari]|uniref:methylated diphthine methylhydrolase n=1 Tax=Mesorhabditis belari TaxID=2138241 RepID=A0AAF3EFF4_9BILA